jgi:hypothetical protein
MHALEADAGDSLLFEKFVLDTQYRSEGVAVFDVDGDGTPDIVTDQTWYGGPDWSPHEVRAPETYDPATQFAKGFGIYPQDVDGDGWTDIVVAPHPGDAMYWYQNPSGTTARFTPHVIVPAGVAGLETPIMADLFGNGRAVLVMTDSVRGVLSWFAPSADPMQPWVEQPISPPAFGGAGVFTHGIGVGDIGADGRLDVITGYGWFQQTADATVWIPHPFVFGPNPSACSRMFALDLNGDGLADIVCSRPHDYGLHWLEQRRSKGGTGPTFVDHLIDDSISQMHALRVDDLDGDGVPEIVSGKRFWAHGPTGDPGVADTAVLTYFTAGRTPGGPLFVRHDIDTNSGVGTQFAIADVDLDGKPDIVVSSKKGVSYFRQR